jgi:uncharacterized protein YbjT (DUF2867 family)
VRIFRVCGRIGFVPLEGEQAMGRILVFGATGKVGGETVRQLAERGAEIRAATRKPGAYRGPGGVQAVELDYDRPETWDAAVAGTRRLFLVSRPGEAAPESYLIPLFEKARAAGLERVVLHTALGVELADDLGLRKVEKHVMASGVPWTILRPNWFMQNFSHGFVLDSIKGMGGIFLPAAEAKVSFIDTRDIGAVAAKALLEDGHAGKEYGLTGPRALDHAEAAAILSRSAGRTIPYAAIGEDDARRGLAQAGWPASAVEFMLALFRAVRAGHAARVTPDVRTVLGRDPISFEQFADHFAERWR